MKNTLNEHMDLIIEQTLESSERISSALQLASDRIVSSYLDQLTEDWYGYTADEKIEIAASVAGTKDLHIFIALMDERVKK